VTILLCVIVGSWNNYAKEQQFAKLMSDREERDIVVIRDGKDTALSVHNLVVGDILKINAGDQMPADCVLLSGSKVTADESSQTGETKDIEKHPLELNAQAMVNPFLISGTMLKEGKGTAVVVCIGDNTRMGRIRGMMDEEEEMTPLQRKLERIANGTRSFLFC
jgi:P-type Ca2+ transporter type 2C